ncbi:MAG: hypothetical protein H0V10_00215 [Geodermatophilaceae bacterium]|nr:hypothetical protein [Geodermatophilaceae bacterium]
MSATNDVQGWAWDAPPVAGDTVRILLEEDIHHGAEIGVLRDLHRRRQ